MLFVVVQFLARVLIVVINILIGVAQYNDFINATAVAKGWVIVRDLCNMFFIIVLLVIAFGTILKIETYRYNRLLGKLILYAFLINFSKFIAGFWIDIGQVIMMTFVNGFKDAAAGNLATGLGMNEMLTLMKGNVDIDSSSLMNAILLAIALLVIAVIVVIIMTIILLLRILMLWILIVLAPIAFITRIFPNTAKYSDQWWGEFNKQIIVGPVMAFFLWLALTVIALNGADSTNYGFRQVRTEEQAALVENLEGGGSDTARSIAASITTISQNDRLLSYMITIGMLLVALTAAQQLGVAGSKIAGDWSQKIRTGGLTAAGVLSGVAAARLAMRGARGGAKMAGGLVGRKLSTFTVAGKYQPLKYFTPSFWKGYAKRGERLQQQTESELTGAGEEFAQKIVQGFLSQNPHAVGTYREEAIRGNISQGIRHFKETVGPYASTEKMVETMKVAFTTGGKEGFFLRAGAAIGAAEAGNIDDFNQLLMADEIKNARKDENGEVAEDEKERIMKKYQFDDWDEAVNETSSHMKALMMTYFGLDRSKFDADYMLKHRINGAETQEQAENLAHQNALNAGLDDQDRLMGMEWMSNVVLERGLHVEQRHGGYDEKTGKAYVMSTQQAIENIKGLVAKKGLQDIASNITPHAIAARYINKKGGVGINTDASKWDELGDYFYGLIGQMTGREFGRIAPRVSAQLLGNVKAVGSEDAIFDEFGDFYDQVERADTESEEDWQKRRGDRRFESERKWNLLMAKNAAAAAKLYEVHFYKSTNGRISETPAPGMGNDDKWRKDVENRRRASQNVAMIPEDEKADTTAFPVQVNEEDRVDRSAEFFEQANQAPTVATRIGRHGTALPTTPTGFDAALTDVNKTLGDFIDQLKGIAQQMRNPGVKKELETLIDKLGRNRGEADAVNRTKFLGQSPSFQAMYFTETAELLRRVEKAVKATAKPPAGAGGATTGRPTGESEEEPGPGSAGTPRGGGTPPPPPPPPAPSGRGGGEAPRPPNTPYRFE